LTIGVRSRPPPRNSVATPPIAGAYGLPAAALPASVSSAVVSADVSPVGAVLSWSKMRPSNPLEPAQGVSCCVVWPCWPEMLLEELVLFSSLVVPPIFKAPSQARFVWCDMSEACGPSPCGP